MVALDSIDFSFVGLDSDDLTSFTVLDSGFTGAVLASGVGGELELILTLLLPDDTFHPSSVFSLELGLVTKGGLERERTAMGGAAARFTLGAVRAPVRGGAEEKRC